MKNKMRYDRFIISEIPKKVKDLEKKLGTHVFPTE